MEINEGTNMDPRIIYDEERNCIEISGWSFCEKPAEIYQPVFDIINTMIEHRDNPLILNFNLNCFNTASTKSIYEMVNLLASKSKRARRDFKINWYYKEDDLETKEWGEDIAMVSGLKFDYKKVNDLESL